ncbi:MAG: DUF4129 domain-containing protein [Cyclobacteriaceae bacterium]|nr:DUF4129 domain-containing protein [Cyclobacteriaceae bacterium]
MIKKTFSLLMACCLTGLTVLAQEITEYHTFDRETWRQEVKDIDFTEHQQEPESPSSKPLPSPSIFNWVPSLGIGQVLMWLVIIGLAVFIVYLIAKQFYRPQNVKIGTKEYNFTLSSITEEIPRSHLEELLAKALRDQDFRTAIRIYYLMIIQGLNEQQLIRWKRDKTNGDYVREMNGKPHYQDFRQLTTTFDRIWYGGLEVNASNYGHLSPKFQYLLDNISNIPDQ